MSVISSNYNLKCEGQGAAVLARQQTGSEKLPIALLKTSLSQTIPAINQDGKQVATNGSSEPQSAVYHMVTTPVNNLKSFKGRMVNPGRDSESILRNRILNEKRQASNEPKRPPPTVVLEQDDWEEVENPNDWILV